MLAWLKQLDDLLRGRRTTPELLSGGRFEIPLRTFIILAVALGAGYGFFMGWFSIFDKGFYGLAQFISSTVKLPALFLFTLIVTLPSLYVFNALVGGRLDFPATLRVLVAAVVVNLAVAASFGPILGFFTVSTKSYSFMVLLNVLLLAIAGGVGLGFLLQTLRRLIASEARSATSPPGAPSERDAASPPILPPAPGPLDRLPGVLAEDNPRIARSIFRIWLLIYALVGAQMGWILRPFIGNPGQPFQFFRARQGNFFQAVVAHLGNLFGIE